MLSISTLLAKKKTFSVVVTFVPNSWIPIIWLFFYYIYILESYVGNRERRTSGVSNVWANDVL